jgi:hypothetical protein
MPSRPFFSPDARSGGDSAPTTGSSTYQTKASDQHRPAGRFWHRAGATGISPDVHVGKRTTAVLNNSGASNVIHK